MEIVAALAAVIALAWFNAWHERRMARILSERARRLIDGSAPEAGRGE